MDRKTLQVFEAARLCYEMGLSQREVAEDLGVSPATLTRLLQKARDLGIVKFTVQPPNDYSRDIDTLARRLEDALSIEQAIVVPSSLRPEVVRKELGFAAAHWISGQIQVGTSIGFSGGRSVAEIIPFLKKTADGVEVVQLMGGVSPTEIDIQADVIARNAASRLGGTCHVIHGPAIFPNEKELFQILKNRIVADVVDRFDALHISVVGVGTVTADNPLMQCGFLSDKEVELLSESGCVGDICGHFFNGQGGECDAALAKRILGIRLAQLAKIPKVCAVAAGADKVAGIIAACRAGIPKALVTDNDTAEAIVTALGVDDHESKSQQRG
jgi:DNA-binding transcriptional regulator LsrR (DeoR family)